MATNTPKLNLVKPDMADYADIRVLNQNMDILDKEVGGLNYVKNVVKSDTGLTFTKKDDSEIQVPLNYLPITGGNLTGDLTIQNNQVISIVDVVTTEKQTSVKYSNGTLIQYGTIDNPSTTNFKTPFTFQIPFINDEYIVFTSIDGDRLYPNGTTFNTSMEHPCWVYRMNKTTTNCLVAGDDYVQGLNIFAIGKWK